VFLARWTRNHGRRISRTWCFLIKTTEDCLEGRGEDKFCQYQFTVNSPLHEDQIELWIFETLHFTKEKKIHFNYLLNVVPLPLRSWFFPVAEFSSWRAVCRVALLLLAYFSVLDNRNTRRPFPGWGPFFTLFVSCFCRTTRVGLLLHAWGVYLFLCSYLS
jgi:hypothetical protein